MTTYQTSLLRTAFVAPFCASFAFWLVTFILSQIGLVSSVGNLLAAPIAVALGCLVAVPAYVIFGLPTVYYMRRRRRFSPSLLTLFGALFGCITAGIVWFGSLRGFEIEQLVAFFALFGLLPGATAGIVTWYMLKPVVTDNNAIDPTSAVETSV